MQYPIIILLSAFLTLTALGTAHAEKESEVEAGIRTWINLWTREVPGANRVTSDRAWLIGPELSTRIGDRIAIEALYLISASDYSFKGEATASELKRQDAEVTLIYLFLPGVGLSAGYRAAWFREKDTGLEETLYGPVIGIRGDTSFSREEPSAYGKVAYQFTKFKQEETGSTFREDSPGWIAELGLRYAFTPDFSTAIGYKYEMNKGKDSDTRDTFHGPLFAASFIF